MTIEKLPAIARKSVVSYSNNLVEARYSLSLIEQKLIFAMVSFISPEDVEFKTYKIGINELADYMNIHRKTALRELDLITDKIMSGIIKIPRTNKNGEPELYKTHWASHCVLSDKTLEFSFHNQLMPYLLQLKTHFTKHSYQVFIQFRGAYTTRIYQILKMYEFRGECQYDIYELRDILEIDGNKYKTFKSFRQWVINPAKKEMDKKDKHGKHLSDITFDIETIKSGRFIKSIKFHIRKQSYQEKPSLDPLLPEKPPEILNELIAYGISKDLAQKFVEESTKDELSKCIKLYEDKLSHNKVKDTSGAYLLSMLKAGAGKKTKVELRKENFQQEKQRQEVLDKLHKKRSLLEKQFQQQKMEEFLASLSNDELEDYTKKVLAEYEGKIFETEYIKNVGLNCSAARRVLMKLIPGYEEEKQIYISSNTKNLKSF